MEHFETKKQLLIDLLSSPEMTEAKFSELVNDSVGLQDLFDEYDFEYTEEEAEEADADVEDDEEEEGYDDEEQDYSEEDDEEQDYSEEDDEDEDDVIETPLPHKRIHDWA